MKSFLKYAKNRIMYNFLKIMIIILLGVIIGVYKGVIK